METNETQTVVGVNITTGKEVEPVVVHFNASHERMTVLIEGYTDENGVENVHVTASGPEATPEGLVELGEVLERLGEVLASKEMADAVSGGDRGE